MSAALLEGHALWSGPPGVLLRVAGVAAAGWLPLAVLTAAQAGVETPAAGSFAFDYAVHARSLVAAPLFVAAERVCVPYLGLIARQFADAGLVAPADRPAFEAVMRSTQRLCRSGVAQIVVIALAYGLIVAILAGPPVPGAPAWHRGPGGTGLSPAGWWHALVSLPLLLVLFFGWMWRVLLWTRFLWRVARLDLRLIPAHPDRAAGLLFVAQSMPAFSILAFAIGAIVAGTVANEVVHAGHELTQHGAGIFLAAAFPVVVFGGPLLVFSGKLLRARWRGILEYGAIADGLGRRFERKWLADGRRVPEDALQAPDFSATTDLYSIVANVYNMRLVPADLRSVAVLAGMALLPFVPVVVLAIPADVLIGKLSGLLF